MVRKIYTYIHKEKRRKGLKDRIWEKHVKPSLCANIWITRKRMGTNEKVTIPKSRRGTLIDTLIPA